MYKVHVQQTGNNVSGIVAYTCGTVDSTRGVHLIKDLHIALANKPLQICFQLTVDPKLRLHRS